jgi:hypothetical protein
MKLRLRRAPSVGAPPEIADVYYDGRSTATFLGEPRAGATADQLAELVDPVRYNAMYPWVASCEEIELLATRECARGVRAAGGLLR